MPQRYAIELICDYLAAGHAYMGDKFSYVEELKWWHNKCKCCAMHPQTKLFVTYVLENLWEQERDGCSSIIIGFESLQFLWNVATTAYNAGRKTEDDI